MVCGHLLCLLYAGGLNCVNPLVKYVPFPFILISRLPSNLLEGFDFCGRLILSEH